MALRLASAVWLLLAAVAIVHAAPSPSAARAAREHLRVGLDHYQRGRFDDATREFLAGLAADPQPEFLYALGQSERRRGQCRQALEYYRAFIRSSPSLEQVGATSKVVAICEKEVADEDAKAPKPKPATVVLIAPDVIKPAVEPLPWWRDPLGGAFFFAGLAGAGVGGGLFGATQDAWSSAGTSYDKYLEARGNGGLRAGGIALLAVGGGLIVGGIIRYAWRARRVQPAR